MSRYVGNDIWKHLRDEHGFDEEEIGGPSDVLTRVHNAGAREQGHDDQDEEPA